MEGMRIFAIVEGRRGRREEGRGRNGRERASCGGRGEEGLYEYLR